MATRQILVRIPEEPARRLRTQVPVRGRSAFVRHSLEHALAQDGGDDDPLYRVACDAERDERLIAEMAEWDTAIADGLETESCTAERG